MSQDRLHPSSSYPFDEERLAVLRAIAPEAFADGKINWDVLRALLGDALEDDDSAEHYGLSWPGKREARRRASTPSRGTLIPMPGQGVNEADTRHLIIEADNLEALKLLQKAYAGRVKMIYIDPPYNTGNDFVYRDDFAEKREDYLLRTGQVDESLRPLTSNSKSDGRFHSNWLSMMYPRLRLARTLLREDGVIFVSIDDNEVHNLRLLMDEVFGAENFVAQIIWQHSLQPKGYTSKFSVHHNFILCYGRSERFEFSSLERTDEHNKNYSNPDNDPKGLWRAGDVRNALYRPNLIYDIVTPSGKVISPPPNGWRWSRETVAEKIRSGEIIFNAEETRIIRKIYLATVDGRAPETIWLGKDVGTTRSASSELKLLFGERVPFDTPKPVTLIRQCLSLVTLASEGDIILDFFAGSGTTAQAVLELNEEDGGNRQFILVQLAEETAPDSAAHKAGYATIAEITRERVRRVIARLQAARQGKLDDGTQPDLGFQAYRYHASHYKPWQDYSGNDAQALQRQFAAFASPLVDDWQPEGLLSEVMLLNGFPPNSLRAKLAEGAFWRISHDFHAHALFVCLEKSLDEALLEGLNVAEDDVLVCLDSALSDTLKLRLRDRLRLRTI